ncbi:hypothetical protein G7046_g6215 [Stylonectria norvegica]|nr:hypothetical protein G7046_g6215 [Stylonectria norvegica]
MAPRYFSNRSIFPGFADLPDVEDLATARPKWWFIGQVTEVRSRWCLVQPVVDGPVMDGVQVTERIIWDFHNLNAATLPPFPGSPWRECPLLYARDRDGWEVQILFPEPIDDRMYTLSSGTDPGAPFAVGSCVVVPQARFEDNRRRLFVALVDSMLHSAIIPGGWTVLSLWETKMEREGCMRRGCEEEAVTACTGCGSMCLLMDKDAGHGLSECRGFHAISRTWHGLLHSKRGRAGTLRYDNGGVELDQAKSLLALDIRVADEESRLTDEASDTSETS